MKTQIFPINQLTNEQLQAVAHGVEDGALVALATDTVYGIAANAFNEKAIERIYAIKQRPANVPLQILVGSAAAAREIVCWDERAEKLAQCYWPGPLTLILPPNEKGKPLLRGFAGLGLRVPAHCGLLCFLKALSCPLACTSANIHGQPVITAEEELLSFVKGKADFVLTDATLAAVASSVVDLTSQPGVLLREGTVSRGNLEKTLKEGLK